MCFRESLNVNFKKLAASSFTASATLLWDINHMRICNWNRHLSNDLQLFLLLIVSLKEIAKVLPIDKPFVIRGILKIVIIWETAA